MRTEYVIDPMWGAERRRLHLMEQWADTATFERLAAISVEPGWRCVDVGAGAGSVVRWLAARVGADGWVVAADIDTRWLSGLDGPNVDVVTCDVRSDDPPGGPFDLVHARFLLAHLPDRISALRRMLGWLRPGGWFLFEDSDISCAVGSPLELWRRWWQATAQLPGVAPDCGRSLATELRELGAVDIDMAADVALVRGETPLAELQQLHVSALRKPMTGAGLFTDRELDALTETIADSSFLECGPALISVWGRRPDDSPERRRRSEQ